MDQHIYIIGTNHPLQLGENNYSVDQQVAAKKEVEKLCKLYNVKQLAEEMSECALQEAGKVETIFKSVAQNSNLKYLLVDIGCNERAALGICDFRFGFAEGNSNLITSLDDELSSGIRERVWLSKIIVANEWPVFFICGADHVVNFTKLIKKCQIQVTVLHQDYEP